MLQQILHSRPFTLLFRFLIKPLLWTGAAWLLLPDEATNSRTSAGTAVSIFLAVNLLLNSRLGRNLEEVVADWIVQGWHRFGLRVITGLFWFVVDLFQGILETIERLMYCGRRMAPVPQRRERRDAGDQGRARTGVVLRGLRGALLRQRAVSSRKSTRSSTSRW